MNDQNQSRLSGLILSAGGDSFIILSAIFAVLLVTANFQTSSPESQSGPSKKELKQKSRELTRKTEELRQKKQKLAQKTRQLKSELSQAKSRLKELGIELSGSSSGAAPENTPIYVYLRQGGSRQAGGQEAGDLVVEKGGQAQSVRQGELAGVLQELGGQSVVLLAEPGVPSGTVTRLVDQVKGALPEASTSLGTLKK